MDFHTYITMRDWNRRTDPDDRPAQDIDLFYKRAILDAQKMGSGQFFGQMHNERDWEKARRPYYNLWPSIIPMLTRLNLDLDSNLIQLPLPALCIRFPKDTAKNPLKFDWKGDEVAVRCVMLGEINRGTGLSILVDIGEVMGEFGVPIYTYRNFPRKPGLTVEKSLADLEAKGLFAEVGIVVPESLMMDCIRLCCSLCLLENDPEIISPDVLADDRAKFEASGDQKFVDKAHRRGKVGWDVGKHIEVIPHFRRPHMTLVWTGAGRAVPRIVPRRGSIVHREAVEKLPSGFGGG
jgi:hypothetical protein